MTIKIIMTTALLSTTFTGWAGGFDNLVDLGDISPYATILGKRGVNTERASFFDCEGDEG